jgi:hypothetical protein
MKRFLSPDGQLLPSSVVASRDPVRAMRSKTTKPPALKMPVEIFPDGGVKPLLFGT